MRRLSDSIKALSKTLRFGAPAEELPEQALDLSRLQESGSESEIEAEEAAVDDESEEDVALSEVEVDEDADVVPHQKKTVDNHRALRSSLKSIELPKDARKVFYEHMSITSAEPIVLKDIYDDTERELAFYKQGLEAAKTGRSELKKAKIPFSRPVDFFAEMVKSDEHMDKLKAKLISEEKAKKASQEAKKQRELKKFGKKVQHAQLQARQKEKRETLDKIKGLKRKRGSDKISESEFDVQIEDALKEKPDRAAKYGLGANAKRQKKNQKYGFGGKKRGASQNTKESSMDVSDFSNKKKRPGKSRRK